MPRISVGLDAPNSNDTFRIWSKGGDLVWIAAENLESHELLEAAGPGSTAIRLSDGTWSLRYGVVGDEGNTLAPVVVDTRPPDVQTLESFGETSSGSYVLGADVRLEGAEQALVSDAHTGIVLADQIPTRMTLPPGNHILTVRVTDAAGNVASRRVHVLSHGDEPLPMGLHTFGVVARYQNTLTMWKITEPSAYASVEEAALAAPEYLGVGYGIDPGAACLQEVVAQEVNSSMNTMERALHLFRWLFDSVEYDHSRLSSDTLLTQCNLLMDSEAVGSHDHASDGLSDPGTGNGIIGGVCRDLAALFTALLRAAGVPARIVTGYVPGEVDGFHAWVEFYAGSPYGDSAWVPVDVSRISGRWMDRDGEGHPLGAVAQAQAFAILAPDFLVLRRDPMKLESGVWWEAASFQARWPPDADPPDITMPVNLTKLRVEWGGLCYNSTTGARLLGGAHGPCGVDFDIGPMPVMASAALVIDYGVLVADARSGTSVTASVAYPVSNASSGYRIYGGPFEDDLQKAMAVRKLGW